MAEYSVTLSVACPTCQSDEIIKHGNTDGQQRYICKDCDKTFHASGKARRMRHTPDQIGAAVQMYYQGLSYKSIGLSLAEQYDIPAPSKPAIYAWVKEYTEEASDEMESQKARTGGNWVVDEMQVTVGGVKYWNWNVMDADTRYVLATHLSQYRDGQAAKSVLYKAMQNADHTPKSIKSDKLPSYEWAIKNLFGNQVKHVQSDGIRAEINNNMSERLQGSFRQRTKTMRGLQSRESGQRYLDGWVMNYNLFTPHAGLNNRTPAQAADVEPPFGSWEDVVKADGIGSVAVVQATASDKIEVSVRDDGTRSPKKAMPSARRVKPSKVKSSAPKKRRKKAPHPYLSKAEAKRSK